MDTIAVADGLVVPGAQQNQIGVVGTATFKPGDEVVGVEFAPSGAGGVAASFAVDGAEQVT